MRGDHPLIEPEAAGTIFGARIESIRRYVDILASRGIDHGLIGPREADRLWERHVLNSVALAELIPERATVVDVGSGAGLPGIPLAILRPDLDITLLEPLLRRSRFLEEVVDELSLRPRVRTVRARAEDHRDRYDVVAARAVAPLGRLVPWCAGLRERDGSILAMKGSSAADELQAAASELRVAGLQAEILSVRPDPRVEATTVVRLSGRR